MFERNCSINMDVPDRIHISPLGYEKERVLLPAVNTKADKVFLLEHDEPDDEKPGYHEELKQTLRDEGIEIDSVKCDIFDLYPVLGKTADLISEHERDDIYVNLSTGSKISAIGCMIACMVTRETSNVTPYYVRAEEYTAEKQDREVPVSVGLKEMYELPTYHINGPDPEEIQILRHIAENQPVTKKELIKYARQELSRFRDNANKKNIDIEEDDPEVGEYKLLDTHILKPLENREAISIRDVGRSKEVEITPQGENTLRGFDYLLA